MPDQALGDFSVPNPRKLRQGPGAFAWISLALLVLAAGTLVFAVLTGAHGLTLMSTFAVLALSIPTLILMAVWIEVRIDNRAATKQLQAEIASATAAG